ncbi:hypothetical protein TB2_028930 [Malus domestica]
MEAKHIYKTFNCAGVVHSIACKKPGSECCRTKENLEVAMNASVVHSITVSFLKVSRIHRHKSVPTSLSAILNRTEPEPHLIAAIIRGRTYFSTNDDRSHGSGDTRSP